MDGILATNSGSLLPSAYSTPIGSNGLALKTLEDLQADLGNQQASQNQAAGYQNSFQSFDSPVSVTIQERQTDTSLITYDAQGNARNIGESEQNLGSLFGPSATYSYASAKESINRLLNLQIKTAEGDKVSISSHLANYVFQNTLDGTANLPLPKTFEMGTGSSGGSVINIVGDLNQEEQKQVGQILDAGLAVASLSERYARGEDVGEDLKSAITGLNNLKGSLSQISAFGGSIVVSESEDVEHRVMSISTAPVRSTFQGRSEIAGKSDGVETKHEGKKNIVGLREFLLQALDIFDAAANKLLEKDPQRDQKKGLMEKLQAQNRQSLLAAYDANSQRAAAKLEATA